MEIDGNARQKPAMAYLDIDVYTKTVNGTKTKDLPKWINNGRKPSHQQKRKIITLTLNKNYPPNHIYSFNIRA